ncbi:serine/threonine-protein kinase [Thermomonospora umbrina]|uniref:non-specific serine/threonine protein kinase n=1 Tax=Thermomonospora umbrina TaxID=111806 RepID=A0A3D9SK67_9ACTN|nr:serine/threonine-protein kinase [Thermomonospora umbrina]REE96289.1 serine/threonine protein kinase [Thermomonospora umbrina]
MGEVLAGRYELATPLGRGGMGQVWEGTDRKLGRRVAIKLVTNEQIAARSDPSELVRRFAREASVTAGLQHPGIPAVHDAGTYDGGLFLVMELIEGYTLADLIAEQGPLPVGWAAAMAAQMAAVLAVAHERGLVHRDVKPQNVMLTRDGTVKVLDFGVATVLDTTGAQRITRTGEPVGTPAYMAPEQLRGERATPRTDLYALGCVLYELLAGEPVFEGATPHVLSYRHMEEPPAPLQRPDVPLELHWLIRQLLAKHPEQRPGGAREVYERLLMFVRASGPLADVETGGARPSAMHLYSRVLVRLSGFFPPPGPHPTPNTSWVPAPPRPSYGGAPLGGGLTGGLQRSTAWKLLHTVWALPSLVLGFFTWVGFMYVGVRHQRVSWVMMGFGYLALAVGLVWLLASIPPEDAEDPRNFVGAVWLLALWIAGLLHTAYVAVIRLRLRAAQETPRPYGG